ncbi:MAG: citrate synthase [Acidobacteriota bacterium]|nr:MAG: citrate synthase [Acidobacteriota bacterium]
MASTAKLTYNGKELELPVVEGSEGEIAVDISKLRPQSGLTTLDPGYANTGSCQSTITFINGEKGILRYRGYPIEEIAEKSSFLEVAYLLIYGVLPKKKELAAFVDNITHHTMLHENVKSFFGGFRRDAHPMAIASAVVGALATFYPEHISPAAGEGEKAKEAASLLVAKFPTIGAYSYKHSIGQPYVYPDNSLDYASNFLHMMFATPCEEYKVDPTAAKALDLLLILHADHEQNCSTSTVRVVGSSDANLFASVSAGVSALWGPLHGGANQAVIEMLGKIIASGDSGKKFLENCKDKKSNIRLMGFGHRVYKNFDPRATILKKTASEVLKKLKKTNPLLDVAMELEEIALKDSYFVERKLYPNVDFYSGIIYQALEIPTQMFTVLFAIGRLPGWIAQWMEMRQDPKRRIARPRQVYTGETKRPYVPISAR